MGHLFLIVGPSGAGKDTLINYVTERLPIKRVKRVITRASDEYEDFTSVNEEEFDKQEYFITWESYGRKYGIPQLGSGDYIINVSRDVINKIKKKRPDTIIIELKTKPEVLKQRLEARTRGEVKERLERRVEVQSDIIIETSNPDSSVAGEELVSYLRKKLVS